MTLKPPVIMQEEQVRKQIPLLQVPDRAGKLYRGAGGAGPVLIIRGCSAVRLSSPLSDLFSLR